MKILYLSNYELDLDSGVTQKIKTQLTEWEKRGNNVIYICLKTLTFYSSNGEKLTKNLLKINRKKIGLIINLFISSIKLKKILQDIDFDLIYMRYNIYDPFFKGALRHKPLIVEMNSNDVEEAKLRSKVGYYYNKFFRNYFLNNAKGFICISEEIKRDTLKKGMLSRVIANGIDTSLFSYRKFYNKSSRPSLVFIGTPGSPWHGIDKIINLSLKLPEFDFHIIGEIGENTQNLFYHGYLPMKLTIEIIQTCNVGICTMALHRKKMSEASPLKSRQYLAMGLPIIYAYDDTDFPLTYPFALKLPNEENNLDKNVQTIKNYVQKVATNDKIHLMARQFAVTQLDVKQKEQQRLDFFNMVFDN